MEEESSLVRRAKSAILVLIFVAVVIFPLFQERKEFFEDRIGDPEIQLMPNTEKMQITLFPTKGQYGTGFYTITRDANDPKKYKIVLGNVAGALAQGALTAPAEGYNRLIIQGSDIEASGYLEGYLTLAKIKQFYLYVKETILQPLFDDPKLLKSVENYYTQVFADLLQKSKDSKNEYDKALYRSLKRLEGICMGFNDHVSSSAQLDVSKLFIINSLHEMIALSSQKSMNKSVQSSGSPGHAPFLVTQNFGSTYVMKLSSQYIQHVHTMFTAIPTSYRLSKYYYHTAGAELAETDFNREISIVAYPGMIIGMDSFNAIKSSIMYYVNPLNSMKKQSSVNDVQLPLMDFPSTPFFLQLASSGMIAKNGKELAQLLTEQNNDDKLSYYSVTIIDIATIRSSKLDSNAQGLVLLLEKAKNEIKTTDITKRLAEDHLWITDGISFDDHVREQTALNESSLENIFDAKKFATGAKNAYTLAGLAAAAKSSFNRELIANTLAGDNFMKMGLSYIEEGLTTRL